MTQEMSSRRGWRALGPTNIRLRWSREGIETVLQTFGSAGAGKGSRVLQTFGSAGAGKASRRSYEHSAPLEPGRDRDGPTNSRLRWSREGIESPTNIRLRWSREGIETILRTFGSAGAGKGSRRSYKHSAPLEPGRDREGPTNIPLRWSREGVESPTNIRLRWSREGVEGSGCYSSTCASLEKREAQSSLTRRGSSSTPPSGTKVPG